MNYKLITLFLMTFLLASAVSAEVSLPDYSGTIAKATTETLSQTATNTDSLDYSVSVSVTDLINTADNSYQIDSADVSFTSPFNLLSGGSASVTLDIDVPSNIAPGTYQGTITLQYNNGTDDLFETSTITATVTNAAPSITSIADQTIFIGEALSLQVSASDSDDSTITYSLSGEPSGMTISNSGLISGWTPTALGTETVTVSVSDSFTSSSDTFDITVQANTASVSITDDVVLLGGDSQNRGEQVQQTVTVTNTGTQTLTGLGASLASLSGGAIDSEYQTTATIAQTTLTAGESTTVTITGFVPSDQDAEPETIGRVTVTGQGTSTSVSDNANVQLQARSYLRIKDVEITVDGDNEDIDDGDEYDEIREGDSVKVVVTLENTYSDSDNIQIENAYFEIEADESDWDIEEDSDEEDIDEDDDQEFTVSFTIDDDIDEDQTDVTIRAYGEDEEGNFDHYDELTFSFEIEREDDEISIVSYDLSKNPVQCTDRTVTLDVKIKNTGTDDQDEVTLQLISSELDWNQRVRDVELDEGDSESYTFTVPLEEADRAGSYFIDVETFYDDDDESDEETIVIEVLCNDEDSTTTTSSSTSGRDTSDDEDEVVVITTTNNQPGSDLTDGNTVILGEPTYGKPIGSLDNFRESSGYTAILIVAIIVVIGLIALIGASLPKK